MTDQANTFHLKSFNDYADFWRYQIGVNVIPADTKNKKPLVAWLEDQDKPINTSQHNQWKADNTFSNGMAIIPGKVWHKENKKEMYFIFIDLDKRIAIEEFCTINTKNITLQLMAQITLVEQHKDRIYSKERNQGLCTAFKK